ncbi:MAG: class I SAM-dependent methyltransferase [Candidatus Dormibacteraeota bacterium]|nr:class I SAM-dependent methyltransferase [Candidatus Dormibacteraeota bacterium]
MPGNRLLDVACGTGKHLVLLRDRYEVEGLDLDPEMLAISQIRLPDVRLHRGDFRDFDLEGRFDVVTCLFSSIAYARNTAELRRAIACLARHVEAGGVIVVEPFITPEQLRLGHVEQLCVEEPDLKVTRMSRVVDARDGHAVFEFQYLVGRADGIEHIVETHELSLFRKEDYLEAFALVGLEIEHDPEGLMGRGLFVGIRG